MLKKRTVNMPYSRSIALGFIIIIIVGAIILCLPVSSRTGQWTPLLDALFTATSATCVTGLVLYDTYTYWSVIGQVVILCLIQVGGIGFMTVIILFSVFRKRKIGLHERQLLVQSTGMLKLSGVVSLVKRIVLGVLCFELAGAVLLATRFCPQMGLGSGVYYAVFHSVSAFCNAGFDIMGKYGQFRSLTGYVSDPVVSLTVIMLIILGGIGFFVWDDIVRHKWRFNKYALHSKIVLTATGMLIATGWLLFYILEYKGILAGLNGTDKVIAALFQSVTPRTAGFNTIDTAGLSEAGSFLTVLLMIAGGSSGSTAGGIKTTTLAVLLLSAVAAARRKRHVTIFKRSIDDSLVRESGAFLTIYLSAVIIATILLCAFEPFTLKQSLFEAASAIGTVGLTTGITPYFGTAAKIVVTLLMFIGRVGCITLVMALAGKQFDPPVERVPEKILIG